MPVKPNIFLIILMLMMVLTGNASAQHASDRYKNDIEFLKNSFEQHSPSLYRFNTKKEVDKLFNDAANAVDHHTDQKGFYRIIKRILAGIKDGHLSSSPSDSLNKAIDEKEMYFPVSMLFLNKQTFVDCDHLNRFSSGTEVIAIDDKDINTIRKTLFEYIVADGSIETKKYHILSRTFWFYYNLVYGSKETHSIKYRLANGETGETAVKAESLNNITCKSNFAESKSPLLSLSFPKESTALLIIRSFSIDELNKSGYHFKQFLDSVFRQLHLRNTQNLIIDLRNNTGGKDAYGALLYSYITDKPFTYYKKLETISGELNEKDHPELALQKASPNNFNGKVYILINGLSFSVTSEFCAVARSNKRATFVGQETGGTYCGNTSGKFKDIILPYSKVSVSIPTIKYTMDVKPAEKSDRGIIPEHVIELQIGQMIGKNDQALNLVLNLLK